MLLSCCINYVILYIQHLVPRTVNTTVTLKLPSVRVLKAINLLKITYTA